MIELFVAGICFSTTPVACENSVTSYYKQAGIEEMVTNKSNYYYARYPIMSNVIAYTAAAAQGRLILNMGQGKSLTLDQSLGTIGYKFDF